MSGIPPIADKIEQTEVHYKSQFSPVKDFYQSKLVSDPVPPGDQKKIEASTQNVLLNGASFPMIRDAFFRGHPGLILGIIDPCDYETAPDGVARQAIKLVNIAVLQNMKRDEVKRCHKIVFSADQNRVYLPAGLKARFEKQHGRSLSDSRFIIHPKLLAEQKARVLALLTKNLAFEEVNKKEWNKLISTLEAILDAQGDSHKSGNNSRNEFEYTTAINFGKKNLLIDFLFMAFKSMKDLKNRFHDERKRDQEEEEANAVRHAKKRKSEHEEVIRRWDKKLQLEKECVISYTNFRNALSSRSARSDQSVRRCELELR